MGTFPHEMYFVDAITAFGPAYFGTPALYVNSLRNDAGVCQWSSKIDNFPGPSVEQLDKIPIFLGIDVIGYSFQLTVTDPSGTNTWIGSWTVPFNEEWPLPIDDQKSCSRRRIKLPHVVFGEFFPATLYAAFPDACDNADWPEKSQFIP